MPELPEVETVKRTLENVIIGKSINKVDIIYPGVIKMPSPEQFSKTLEGKKITAVARRGKYLMLKIENNNILLIHLRMTGRLVYANSVPLDKHIHVIIRFTDDTSLYYKDLRKFGTIYLLPPEKLNQIRGFAVLGPEPLSDDFKYAEFAERIKKSRKKIKQLLLDQEVVAGLGNIYADEVLFEAQIHPERIAAELLEGEIKNLFNKIKEVLAEGIEHGGTSFRDYVDGFGKKGQHQNYLRVYQKHNKPCQRCNNSIIRTKVGGRSSYHCPECQK